MGRNAHRIRPRDAKSSETARELLRQIWGSLTVHKEGITYDNIELFQSLVAVLANIFRFPSNWYHQEISSRIARAALETKRAGAEDLDSFIVELNKLAQPLLNARARAYKMWTKLSLHEWGKSKAYLFKIGNVHIVLRKQVPSSLHLDKFFISGIGDISPEFPKGGVIAIARGRFRSDQQAGDGLHRSITDLASIINLALQSRRREWRSGKAKPKSKLLVGDNQYLFRGRKNLNTESIWYNPDFREDFWIASNFRIKELERVSRYVRKLLREIDNHTSGERIMSSIRMMGEGWTSHDEHHRILRTWTAFELLLSRSPERADRFEDIIKRATFIAKDRQRWSTQLLHAALTRNRYVHENAAAVSAGAVATALDAYLTALIEWMLFSSVKFESHARLLDMLDLPPDPEALQRQATDRSRAIQILST